MKSIVITTPGPPDVLQVAERPTPALKSGDVLVKVMAAGVNRPDIAQRKGNYPPPSWTSPDIPGLEVSGTIEDGYEGTRWRKGDKVCALVTGGGYSEYCAVPAGQCLPIPAALSFAEAASLPETVFTVWSNVFNRGRLKSGERILIHGGSSGIGVTAIQMAKAAGAEVYVTAGTDDKCRFCESLGANAINYRNSDFKNEILDRTGQEGVDVVLDMVGGEYTTRNLQVLREEGRLIQINFMKGENASVPLGLVMKKRLFISGSMLRSRDTTFKSLLASEIEQHVWPWFIAGSVRPVVHSTFPLERAADAHRLMEEGSHMGKIVLLTTQ